MSAASSTLLSRAAAVAPPATPPIIRYFITFLVVGFSLLFSVSRRKEKHNFRENIISSGKFIRKDIIFFWKALFCGEESTVLRAGKRYFCREGSHIPVGARWAAATYLPAQGCGCRCREDGCMKSMRENSACHQFQGNYPITNYELQITVSKFQFKKVRAKFYIIYIIYIYYIYNITV